MKVIRSTSKSDEKDKQIPLARWKHAAVVYDKKLYIMGGCSWTTILRDLWCLNLTNLEDLLQDQLILPCSWNTLQLVDCPGLWMNLSHFKGHILPLQSHTMVAYENKLFIFGGSFTNDLRDCPLWIYNIDYHTMEKWQPQSSKDAIPQPRRNHVCLVYQDSMILFGGFADIYGSLGDFWAFNFGQRKWYSLWSTHTKDFYNYGPRSRHNHQAAVVKHEFWIFGGMHGLEYCDDLWSWNFEDCIWTKINYKGGPIDWTCHANTKVRGRWLFYGLNEEKKRPENWVYSFKENQWFCQISCVPNLSQYSSLSVCANNLDLHKSFRVYQKKRLKANKVAPIPNESLEMNKQSFSSIRDCCTFNVSIRDFTNFETDISFRNLTFDDSIINDSNVFQLTPVEECETMFVNEDSVMKKPVWNEYLLFIGNIIEKASFDNCLSIQLYVL